MEKTNAPITSFNISRMSYDQLVAYEDNLSDDRIKDLCELVSSVDLDKYEVLWTKVPTVYTGKNRETGEDSFYSVLSLVNWQAARNAKYCAAAEVLGSAELVINSFAAVAIVKDKDSGIPIMIWQSAEGQRMYLTPFRAYSFQCSATIDGQGSIGSSTVVGLNNVLDARFTRTTQRIGHQTNVSFDAMGRECLRALMHSAMLDATRYGGNRWHMEEMPGYMERSCENIFLEACIKWIR